MSDEPEVTADEGLSDTSEADPGYVAESEDNEQVQNDPMADFYSEISGAKEGGTDFDDDENSDESEAGEEPTPTQQQQPAPEKEEQPEAAAEGEGEDTVASGEDTQAGAEDAAKAAETTPQTPEPAQEQQLVQQPELTAEQLAEQRAQQREQALDLLASQHYKFSEAEVEAFEENPTEFLSKAASRIYLDAVTNSMAQMMQLFPQLLEQTLQQRSVNQQAEDEFFTAWPKLKGHNETVSQLAHTYRQNYPNLTRDQFIQQVGAAAMIALKIAPDAPAVPAQEQPAPHKPAAAAPPTKAPAPKMNFYEELSMEEEADAN